MQLSVIRTLIRNRYGILATDAGITDAVLTDAVNAALRAITLEADWPWLVTSTTFTTMAGTTSYALPTTHLRTLSLVDVAIAEPLQRRQTVEIDRFQLQQGRPYLYAISGSSLLLAPKPDGAYQIQHRFVRAEITLSAGTNSPLLPDPFIDGVVDYAAALAFLNARQDDRANAAMTQYVAWLRRTKDNIFLSRDPLTVRVRPGSPYA
jgi:hypothetical protein